MWSVCAFFGANAARLFYLQDLVFPFPGLQRPQAAPIAYRQSKFSVWNLAQTLVAEHGDGSSHVQGFDVVSERYLYCAVAAGYQALRQTDALASEYRQ